jgi:hypothetical protein
MDGNLIVTLSVHANPKAKSPLVSVELVYKTSSRFAGINVRVYYVVLTPASSYT